jgi:hypothetical protein
VASRKAEAGQATSVNWHEPTEEEKDGTGDYNYLVDVMPDIVNHQAANDGDALLRIGKAGWTWIIRSKRDHLSVVDNGEANTKEAALADAQAALGRLRKEWDEYQEEQAQETTTKKKGWFR